MSGFSFLVLADENRHAVVDQAIGGMEQGRRISSQGHYNNSGNHGYLFTGSGLSNTPSATGTVQVKTEQASGIVNTGAQAGQNGSEQATESGSSGTTTQKPSGASGTGSSGTQVGSAPETTGSSAVHNAAVITQPVTGTTGPTVPEQTGGTQEPSGTSNNPIIGVEVGTNPESGTPNAGIHVDTSGQLEDRQILDAGIVGSGTGSSGAEVGSATDITAQELVHEADITTAQEPAGASGNPIVAVEAGTNPESGMPNVGVAVDTTGELEDKQILQTDLATEGIASSGQVGSASDITGSTGQTTTQEPSGASTNPSVIPIPSDLSAEVDTTGQTVGGTADIGAEAGVSGVSEGEDETCDPADGLTSTACGPLKP